MKPIESLFAIGQALNNVHFDDLPRAHDILHSAWRILFIGNGGSASIASHMAIDFCKNGGTPALALNDSAVLTCVANDMGYDNVFCAQITWHSLPSDVLVAISSSGRSENILSAVTQFQELNPSSLVVTLSGFDADNPLRKMGDVNFYVDSRDYAVVEITHLSILHSLVMP